MIVSGLLRGNDAISHNGMEELNKTQIILLTLLTSFVTSLATGIITVALMDDQATGSVTQTINRVVERTIEKVVPEKGQSAGVVTREVVVKEENLITDSIDKASQSIIRLKRTISTEEGMVEVHASLAAALSRDGILVADATQIFDGATYKGILPDGTSADFKTFKVVNGLAFLKPAGLEKRNDFIPIKFGDSERVKLGQTAILIYGKDRNIISMGIISASYKNEDGQIVTLESNLQAGDIMGSPVMNIFGEIIGIRLAGQSGEYILASNEINGAFKVAVKEAGL